MQKGRLMAVPWCEKKRQVSALSTANKTGNTTIARRGKRGKPDETCLKPIAIQEYTENYNGLDNPGIHRELQRPGQSRNTQRTTTVWTIQEYTENYNGMDNPIQEYTENYNGVDNPGIHRTTTVWTIQEYTENYNGVDNPGIHRELQRRGQSTNTQRTTTAWTIQEYRENYNGVDNPGIHRELQRPGKSRNTQNYNGLDNPGIHRTTTLWTIQEYTELQWRGQSRNTQRTMAWTIQEYTENYNGLDNPGIHRELQQPGQSRNTQNYNVMDNPGIHTELQWRGQSRNTHRTMAWTIQEYTEKYNGLDKNDQLRSYCGIATKAKKWGTRPKPLSHLEFHLEVAKGLINGFSSRKRKASLDVAVAPPLMKKTAQHELSKTESKRGVRNCVVCAKDPDRTPAGNKIQSCWECKNCGVALCKEKGRFGVFHNFQQ
ncbi:hypothetical protein ACOMHN_016541 [Nucella lapillus]